jgi:uncharacterized Zn finger protein
MGWGYYPRYVSVGEKKEKAAKKLAQLRKKNPNIMPVIIKGRTIAATWWGRAWNQNLERYADYSNRIGRGRSYVCNGMVLDLQIHSGEVNALVMGTSPTPYSVRVKIKSISPEAWDAIKETCQGKLDSLPELLKGKFPKALEEIFTAKGKGLFPSPDEIEFSCSCPDWAYMCKHVAAALYAIGARLDEDPMLFFKLRNADANDLITRAVEEETRILLKKTHKKSARVIDDADLSGMFGIDMEDAPNSPKTKESAPSKTVPEKSGKKPLIRKARAEKTAKAGTSPKIVPETAPLSDVEIVAKVIPKTRKGMDIAAIVKKTGFEERKIYNIIYRLKKQGRVVNVERGIYRKI